MDSTLPDCAQLRQCGTVIIKSKDDCYRICSTGRTNFVSTEKCELCVRTRTNSQYSDCDSEKVKKCRPHRSSTARSRYVNVCAAVCLLLLAGELSPQSSAAPRHRRDMEHGSNLWENPCGWAAGSTPSGPKEFTKEHAEKVANAATHALDMAKKNLNSKFAASFDYQEKSNPGFTWVHKSVSNPFLKMKSIGKEMSSEDLSTVTSNMKDQLPDMYYALKTVVAGLYTVKEKGLDLSLKDETDLQPRLGDYLGLVAGVLCEFSEGFSQEDNSRLEEVKKPIIDSEHRVNTVSMIYRDSKLYLDYLRQVMERYARDEGNNQDTPTL